MQPLFITIDPARDTPEVLAQYVPSFHPRLLGLTGTADEIAAVARAYKVVSTKYQPPHGGPYLIDHTAFTYIVMPRANTAACFRQGRRKTGCGT